MDAPCSCTCSAQYSASGSNCCEKGITGKAVCIVAAKVSGKWFKNSTGTNHTDMEQDEQKEIDEKLSDGETIKSHSSIYYEEYSVTAGKSKDNQTIKMICPEKTDDFSDYISLDDRKTKQQISLSDDGVVISERLAKLLDVSDGDTITLKDSSGKSMNLKIADITEMYTGHFVFTSPARRNFPRMPI